MIKDNLIRFKRTYSPYVFSNELWGSGDGTNGVLDSNILAIIPLNSGLFTTTFDNNSNFIFKKRDYFGPVDISSGSRLTIHRVSVGA